MKNAIFISQLRPMTLNCMVVEDEPLARNLMTQYIQKVSSLTLAKACASPLEAMEILEGRKPTENGLPVDILFLDVQMPEITGISLLKILQHKPYIILTTAYSEYALEGYALDVMDYLLKPITFERFLQAVARATQRLSTAQNAATITEQSPNFEQKMSESTPSVKTIETAPDSPFTIQNSPLAFIFVKDGTKLIKVKLADIQYIEGLKDYVTIHTPDKKITTLQRLKTLEDELPAADFVRIHNSYIVALAWIDVIHKDKVQIGKVNLPISDTYRKAFKEFIERPR
jgi:two-component system, LytTR family, response regulator